MRQLRGVGLAREEFEGIRCSAITMRLYCAALFDAAIRKAACPMVGSRDFINS
jgi:hypothetical protein